MNVSLVKTTLKNQKMRSYQQAVKVSVNIFFLLSFNHYFFRAFEVVVEDHQEEECWFCLSCFGTFQTREMGSPVHNIKVQHRVNNQSMANLLLSSSGKLKNN